MVSSAPFFVPVRFDSRFASCYNQYETIIRGPACAGRWKELQRENAPLRVCLNGGLQSMPENFYDSFLLRELERLPEEFLEASLVGNVLGRYQLGVGDGWLALRIEAFCREGLLEVAQDGPGIRRRLRQHSDWASL